MYVYIYIVYIIFDGETYVRMCSDASREYHVRLAKNMYACAPEHMRTHFSPANKIFIRRPSTCVHIFRQPKIISISYVRICIVYKQKHAQTYSYTYTYKHTYTHTYTYMKICTYAYTYTYTYTYACTCTYTYIHINIET